MRTNGYKRDIAQSDTHSTVGIEQKVRNRLEGLLYVMLCCRVSGLAAAHLARCSGSSRFLSSSHSCAS